jgi:hypothetical protein
MLPKSLSDAVFRMSQLPKREHAQMQKKRVFKHGYQHMKKSGAAVNMNGTKKLRKVERLERKAKAELERFADMTVDQGVHFLRLLQSRGMRRSSAGSTRTESRAQLRTGQRGE